VHSKAATRKKQGKEHKELFFFIYEKGSNNFNHQESFEE